MNKLGAVLFFGLYTFHNPVGIAADDRPALPWSELSCGEDGAACLEKGEELLLQKRGGEALSFFAKACHYGEPTACAKVAWSHARAGEISEAYVAFQRACALNHGPSCFYLGDRAEATSDKIVYYQRACSGDVDIACEQLSDMKSYASERDDMFKPCNLTEQSGCLALGRDLLRSGAIGQAVLTLGLACEKTSDEQACHEYGLAYLEDERFQEAREVFTANCQKHIEASCQELGEMDKQADDFFGKEGVHEACRSGVGKSCFQLARRLSRDAKFGKALFYFKQGCAYGHGASCRQLREEDRGSFHAFGPSASL